MKPNNASSKKRSCSSRLVIVDDLKFDTSDCLVDLSNQGDVDLWNRYFGQGKRPRRKSVMKRQHHVASADVRVAGNPQKKPKSRPRKRSIGRRTRKEMLEDYYIPEWDFSCDFLDNVADVSDDFRWGRAGTPVKKKTILNWTFHQLDETEDLKRRYAMCQLRLFQLDQPFSRDREPQPKAIPSKRTTAASVAEASPAPQKSKKLRSLLPLRRRHKYGR